MRRRLEISIILIIGFIFPTLTYAVNPGFYLGLMGGPGRVQKKSVTTISGIPVVPTDNPFVGRLYFGYDFSIYAGVEVGFSYVSRVSFKLAEENRICEGKDPESQIAAVDLSGKLILPMGPFSIYGKAGIAANYERSSADFNIKAPCGKKTKETTTRPMFSIGASYDINQNWVVDVSYNQIQTKGIIQRVEYVALGFSYHFVETFCGQFLCDDV